MIEAYGTGMRKIMKAYEGSEEKPVIETTKNAFKITLPNIKVSASTASRILRRMVKSNILKQHGKARSTRYYLSNNNRGSK